MFAKMFLMVLIAMTTAKVRTQVTAGLSQPEQSFVSSKAPEASVNFVARDGDVSESTRGPVITAPEPTSMLLFGSGLVVIGVLLRRLLQANAKGK